nr:uncharacterized protein LOC116818711 isoform X3 [Chelonoidis abingdonii]
MTQDCQAAAQPPSPRSTQPVSTQCRAPPRAWHMPGPCQGAQQELQHKEACTPANISPSLGSLRRGFSWKSEASFRSTSRIGFKTVPCMAGAARQDGGLFYSVLVASGRDTSA